MSPFRTPVLDGFTCAPIPTGFLAKRMRGRVQPRASATTAHLESLERERDLRRIALWVAEGKL